MIKFEDIGFAKEIILDEVHVINTGLIVINVCCPKCGYKHDIKVRNWRKNNWAVLRENKYQKELEKNNLTLF